MASEATSQKVAKDPFQFWQMKSDISPDVHWIDSIAADKVKP